MTKKALIPSAAVAVLAAAALPALAAKPKTGKWKGWTYEYKSTTKVSNNDPTTFKVTKNGRRMTKFKAVGLVDCPPSMGAPQQVRSISVPRINVKKNGSFNRVYVLEAYGVAGSIHVYGKFKTKRTAKGFIEIREPMDDPVCDGLVQFKAKRK